MDDRNQTESVITIDRNSQGSIHAHGFLQDAVVLSDDAGQFDVGRARAVLGTCGTVGA
jgi:hypothetical protein